MKKLFLLAGAAIVAAITLKNLNFSQPTAQDGADSTVVQPMTSPPRPSEQSPSRQNPVTAVVTQAVMVAPPQPAQAVKALNRQNQDTVIKKPWSIEESYINTRYQLAPQVQDKVAVQIDTKQVSSLESGSQMAIILPDYSRYTAVITRVVHNNSSSRTLTGQLAEDPAAQVIITVSRRSVHATIATPAGSYAMQSTDGEGVLYKVPPRQQLEADLETDALIPDNI